MNDIFRATILAIIEREFSRKPSKSEVINGSRIKNTVDQICNLFDDELRDREHSFDKVVYDLSDKMSSKAAETFVTMIADLRKKCIEEAVESLMEQLPAGSMVPAEDEALLTSPLLLQWIGEEFLTRTPAPDDATDEAPAEHHAHHSSAMPLPRHHVSLERVIKNAEGKAGYDVWTEDGYDAGTFATLTEALEYVVRVTNQRATVDV